MSKLQDVINNNGGLEHVVSNPPVWLDLSRVTFGTENVTDGSEFQFQMPGYKSGPDIVDGREVMWCAAGDDSDQPIAFVLFMGDEGELRGFVPNSGNCYDREHGCAWKYNEMATYDYNQEAMRTELLSYFSELQKSEVLPVENNATNKVRIGFKKVHPDAKLPTYAHKGDAGMDVYAVEDVNLIPCEATLVSTGLVADIPDGYSIQVYPRSGLALKHNVTVWNSPGLVDSSYRGVIGVVLMYIPPLYKVERMNYINGELDKEGTPRVVRGMCAAPYKIKKGDKIAQLVFVPTTTCTPVEVNEVSSTDRGEGGFGSTGM